MNVIECIDIANNPHVDVRDDHAPCTEGTAQPTDRVPRVSLKQWRLFHAVVDNDGFVCAANKLHMSQSSISHALSKLQDQLGIPLLTIRGRKAHITEEGKALLERSRDLVRQAVELEELGEILRHGWEPEVRVAVEPNYPAGLLMRTLRNLLSSHARKIRLNVKEVSLAELRQSLHQDAVDLAISTAPLSGFASNKLIEIEHVAVAHADSPLFRMNRDVTFSDLCSYFEIVFCASDHDETPPVSSGSGQSQRHWKVNSLDSAAEALQFGLGYAWLPRYRVQRWLDDGWVRILPLNSGSSYTVQMHLIRGRAVAPDSGAQLFADALQAVTNEHAARPGFTSEWGVPEAVAYVTPPYRC
jgi:DNA-binding transcriptional LysR family regulator